MKKIFITILSAGSLLTAVSCSNDFLDVNHDENYAYANQVSPKDRLAAAETVAYSNLAGRMNRFGNLMMNAWAGNVYFYASPYNDEFKMQANATFYNTIWDNSYNAVNNFQQIIDAPNSQKYPQHVAIAKIMKAYYMQMIVDLYNDAPYTEAFKGINNMTPKYDAGKEIYKNLAKEIDEAIILMGQAPANNTFALVGTEDPMFAATSADMSNWRKMANTVKLKLVVRVSKSTDPDVIAWRNAQVATLTTNASDYISADVKIQPGYSNAAASQQNPFYNNFGMQLNTGDFNPTYRQTFASEHIIDTMLGYTPATSGLFDPRVARLFINNGVEQALDYIAGGSPGIDPSSMLGMPQGGQKDDNYSEADFATLGNPMFFAKANASGGGSSQAGLVLTAGEVNFLKAEAALAYPSLSGFGAQASFNAGITASFTTLGASGAANYITLSNALPGIGWTATTDKIQAIQYQKWIALTNINPTETFISMNKTGYPVLPMPLGAYYSKRPNRLMYPQSEYVANTANVPNPGVDQMYTVNQYSPFWMK